MIQALHLFLILVVFNRVTAFGGPLQGEFQHCHNEGAQVKVSSELVGNNPCLLCFCKNHTVQCEPLKCPSVQGCYRLQKKRNNECCHSCLGCLYNGTIVAHQSSWVDKCNLHQCQAGVLTSSNNQCNVPCSKPIPADDKECCPRCRGCWLEGRLIPEHGSRSLRHDPCVKCSCNNGHLSCNKRSCPVLSCPPHKAIPDEDGCCFKCNGSRELFVLPNKRCFLGRYLYQSGDRRTYDHCTNCTCSSGFLACKRQTCPILQCPERYRQFKNGHCCAKCVFPKRSQVCMKDGTLREHGDKWLRNQCTECECHEGAVTCHTEHCKFVNKDCPPHFEKVQTESDCCPRCVERPGVCVTYGDPHYKTFDGYKFDFQGQCRYDLAYDCTGRKFVIRVNNDARRSSYFSWTRSLSLKLALGKRGKVKVSLGQKLRVKVNKKRVKLPFQIEGMNITKHGFSVKVSTPLGIQVTWNGASYAEIQVGPEWRNRTCGLCGNFNRNATDDRRSKNGAMAKTDEAMANSWHSGKASTCSRRLRRLRLKAKDSQTRFQRLSCFNSLSESRNRCEILNHNYFDQCRTKVASDQYYKSCLLDLCECPSGRMSECDAMLAFERECEKFSFNMTEWKEVSKCGGFECPYGAMFMTCAPACRPTCKNPRPNTDCYKRRCKPGCYCPPSTVLHRGTCILPQKCPKRYRG